MHDNPTAVFDPLLLRTRAEEYARLAALSDDPAVATHLVQIAQQLVTAAGNVDAALVVTATAPATPERE